MLGTVTSYLVEDLMENLREILSEPGNGRSTVSILVTSKHLYLPQGADGSGVFRGESCSPKGSEGVSWVSLPHTASNLACIDLNSTATWMHA